MYVHIRLNITHIHLVYLGNTTIKMTHYCDGMCLMTRYSAFFLQNIHIGYRTGNVFDSLFDKTKSKSIDRRLAAAHLRKEYYLSNQ
jgi:hypothetical protein